MERPAEASDLGLPRAEILGLPSAMCQPHSLRRLPQRGSRSEDACSCLSSQNGTTDSHRDRGLRLILGRETERRTTTEESAMSNCTRYLGLDVHAETITAAIAEGRGKIRSLGKFPNRPEPVRKLIEKLGGGKNLKV